MLKQKITIIELPLQSEIPIEKRIVSPWNNHEDLPKQTYWAKPVQTSCFSLKKLIRNFLKSTYRLIFHKDNR